MTLTIRKEEDEQRQMKLTVEVAEERIEYAMRQKANQLAREVRVPGFRKGKVPYQVMVRRLGRETLRYEAIEDMIDTVFREALADVEAETYGQPTLEEMEMEPLVLTFTVPLAPVVELGDYREVREEVEPVEVTDEAVDEALEQVRSRHQTLEQVDRPVEAGDLVTLSGTGEFVSAAEAAEADEGDEEEDEEREETADDVIFDEESINLLMDDTKLFPGTPFVENIIGLNTGEHKSFSFTFPEDFEEKEFAGREAHFDVTVLNVQNRDLPPLDDELAKLEGDYETLDELRESLRERLQQQAEDQAKEDVIEGMIDHLLEDAEINYPTAAVEMEIDDAVDSFKSQLSRSGWQFEDYLRLQGSTEESLREDFRESAEERLRRRLALRQFILSERLTVEAEDVDALIDQRVARFDNEELREGMRNFYRSGQGFDAVSSEVLSNKVYERVKAIYAGEAPDLAELAAAAAEDEEE